MTHLFNVGPNNFIPAPKVDSSVIKLEKNHLIPLESIDKIDHFLRICFQNRRKTLFNNLSYSFKKEDIITNLDLLNLDHKIRAQQLSPLDLYNVYRLFYER